MEDMKVECSATSVESHIDKVQYSPPRLMSRRAAVIYDEKDFPMRLICASQASGIPCPLPEGHGEDGPIHIPFVVLRQQSTQTEFQKKKGMRVLCTRFDKSRLCGRGDRCPFLHIETAQRSGLWKMEVKSDREDEISSSHWRHPRRTAQPKSKSGSRGGQPETLQKVSQIRGKICHIASLRESAAKMSRLTGAESSVVKQANAAEREYMMSLNKLSDDLDAKIAGLVEGLGEFGKNMY